MTDAAFEEELKKRNLSAADMREGLRRELLTKKLLDQEVVAKVAVTDQEVNDFFNANRAQFTVAEESYRIAQIVITPDAGGAADQPHRQRCHDAGGGRVQGADDHGAPESGRAVRRSGDGLLRGSGECAARRRSRTGADVGTEAGTRAAAEGGHRPEARDRERRHRRRHPHHRRGHRARAGRRARALDARREGRDHRRRSRTGRSSCSGPPTFQRRAATPLSSITRRGASSTPRGSRSRARPLLGCRTLHRFREGLRDLRRNRRRVRERNVRRHRHDDPAFGKRDE